MRDVAASLALLALPCSAAAGCAGAEQDTDYNGNDLKTLAGITSADACCGECRAAGHQFWTWNPADNKCFLKSSDTGRRTVTDRVSGKVAPAVSCSTFGPSYNIEPEGARANGASWPEKGVKTVAACSQMCADNSDCVAFHYYGEGDAAFGQCYLHSAGAPAGPLGDGRQRYAGNCSRPPGSTNATVSVGGVVAHSAPGYVSANFDWHRDSEEPPAWVNMSAQVIDLGNPLLGQAAAALSPGHLRIGGSEGDKIVYDVPSAGSTCARLGQTDPAFCLSMERWGQLVSFAQSHGMGMVLGLDAMYSRTGTSGQINMSNIDALLGYTAAQKLPVYGFELGNELPHVPEAVAAADYHNLKALIVKHWPSTAGRPKLIGCDQNVNTGYFNKWLPLVADVLDVFTYHHYSDSGTDSQLASKVMTPGYLDKTPQPGVVAAWRAHAPHAELWVGEGAAAWHSGRDGVTNAFYSSFWYADALASLARENHTAYQRQTFIGGNYGLLNRVTYRPNPDFFVAELHHRLMGPRVLDAALDQKGDLRAYAQCTPGGGGSATLLLINLNARDAGRVRSPGLPLAPRDEYVLTAESLGARAVRLNGEPLAAEGGAMPALRPAHVAGGAPEIVVAPHSIGYYVLPAYPPCA